MMLADATPVEIHYHHAWLIWALYFVGAGLHVTLQVSDIAAKNKWTKRAVIEAIWPAVAWRAFFSAAIFGLIWHYPDIITRVLHVVGVNLGGDEGEVLAIPVNNAIAAIYGLMLDSLLGYIPGLKSWLPDVNLPPTTPPAPSTPTPKVA